jgi:pSer/pThr/pTyr-binding forkhead associated (FHA) protein
MRFCPNCGARLSVGGAESREAGGDPEVAFGGSVPLSESTVSFAPAFGEEEDEAGSVEEAAGGAALIELDQVEGTAGRRMHDIEGSRPVSVGRSRGSDIFLDDVTVSRKHAEIFRGGGRGFRIRDAGSLNGTYVNRVRVDAVDLRNGDEIQIGKYRFKFVYA